MKMTDIKPCPFCGEIDALKITDEDTYDRKLNVSGISVVTVKCRRCWAELTELSVYHFGNDKYETLLAALMKRWNTRS